uniref:Uncharacterized protein n=1 Tax=Caulobacter phage BL57 TaxID=3348355 RepID=A0AB74UH33_9VIRU
MGGVGQIMAYDGGTTTWMSVTPPPAVKDNGKKTRRAPA